MRERERERERKIKENVGLMEPCRDTCMLLQWMKFLWMLLFRDIEIATVGTLWHAFWRGPYKHEPKKWGYHQLWGGRFLRCGTLQKLHKAKGQKSCHRVPTIKGRPVVPSLFRLMLIRLEGEGDFFDVGHSKNCIRPKAKKHVTEYPHIYIYIYIYMDLPKKLMTVTHRKAWHPRISYVNFKF